jgi:hypothetical protein
VALFREGVVVERTGCGCQWVYERELSLLEDSEGGAYALQNQFGDRFYSAAASVRLIQVLVGLGRRTGVQFSFLIAYLRQFGGFLPPTGLCDQCYTEKRVLVDWAVPGRGGLPLTMGVVPVGKIPVEEEDEDLFEDPLAKVDRFQSRRVGGAGVEGHFPVCVVPAFGESAGALAPYTAGVLVSEEVVFTTGSGSLQAPL